MISHFIDHMKKTKDLEQLEYEIGMCEYPHMKETMTDILHLKKQLCEKEQYLAKLKRESLCEAYKDARELIQVITQYPKIYPYPEPPKDYGKGDMTILSVDYRAPQSAKKMAERFFPYTEGGYYGKRGECALGGHVQFTPQDISILKKYRVQWRYITAYSTGH